MNPPNQILGRLRAHFKEKHREIYDLHLKGGGGSLVVKALSDLADTLLLKGFQSIDPSMGHEWGGTLIAIGGYGRQELSPSSDIDLMFLLPERKEEQTDHAASQLIRLLWDLGYKVGHSTRTIEEVIMLARQDPLIATSLLESRYVHGDRILFKRFHKAFFTKVIDKHIKNFLSHLDEGREESRRKYGATPYLIEPHLKQSPGGLRDIHYLKWVSCARYHTHHLPQVHQWGHLSNIEYTALVEAQDFLWRVRNHLHFLAGKPSDLLAIELQEEISPFFQRTDRRGFMKEYYIHTGRILEISKRFTREAYPLSRSQKWRRPWKTSQVAPGFQIFSEAISIKSPKPFQFFENDENVLRLFLLAKTHSVRVSDSVLEIIYQVSEKKRDIPLTPAAFSLFKTLMTEPGGIAKTLRIMHRIHLLWRIIPEFEEVNCLVQQSRSHAFTVDEHCFRALEAAEQFRDEEGPFQEIYVAVQKKDLLHLAILLHDIGKGGQHDHSKVGAEVAGVVAGRLGYDQRDRALLVFLVRQHLILSEVALFRDFSNEPVLLKFVETVQDLKALRKLFILTCADIRATAPGMWTSWKKELLLKLFNEASGALSGNKPAPEDEKVSEIIGKLLKTVRNKYPEAWLKEVLLTLIPRYYLFTPFEKVVLDLDALADLQTNPIQVGARFLPDQGVAEYTLYTYDWITSGIFSSMAGIFTAKGLKILSAQVFTHPNGMLIDTFKVIDPDYHDDITQVRVKEIRKDVEGVLTGKTTVEHLLLQSRRFPRRKESPVLSQPVRIEVDNNSSRTFTVIDIYATNRRGLLFVITKAIYALGLIVHAAKIATRSDQVVDVFYVLGSDHKKLEKAASIQRIKEYLIREINLAIEVKDKKPEF